MIASNQHMDLSAEAAEAVREFVVLIAHGDEDHRRWLSRAAEAFCAGKPVPMLASPPPSPKGDGQ